MLVCPPPKAGGGSQTVPTEQSERNQWSATDEEVMDLARMAVKIEKHYGRPMDIEWCRDGDDGKLYIVQARPETVASQKQIGVVEEFKMLETSSDVLAEGRAVGKRIGAGTVSRGQARVHLFAIRVSDRSTVWGASDRAMLDRCQSDLSVLCEFFGQR